MRLPESVSCRMFWISASLSCPLRVVERTRWPRRSGGKDDERDKHQQHPGKLSAQGHHHRRDKDQGKKLLQEFSQHLRSCELNLVDVVDDGRNQCARRVLLEEGGRAAKHRSVQFIAQIGDHPEARQVHQVGPRIKADALEYRGCYQRNGHHGPGILEVLREEALQINRVLGAGDGEQGDVARLRGWMQHAVEHGADQQQAKGVQHADHGHQHHRTQQVRGVWPGVSQ